MKQNSQIRLGRVSENFNFKFWAEFLQNSSYNFGKTSFARELIFLSIELIGDRKFWRNFSGFFAVTITRERSKRCWQRTTFWATLKSHFLSKTFWTTLGKTDHFLLQNLVPLDIIKFWTNYCLASKDFYIPDMLQLVDKGKR